MTYTMKINGPNGIRELAGLTMDQVMSALCDIVCEGAYITIIPE